MSITEQEAEIILQMVRVCEHEDLGPDGLPLALRIVLQFPNLWALYAQDLGLAERYQKWLGEVGVGSFTILHE